MITAKEAAERTLEVKTPKEIDGITFDELIERQDKMIMNAVFNGHWNTRYIFYDDKYWDWHDKANKYYLKSGLGYHIFTMNGVTYIAW